MDFTDHLGTQLSRPKSQPNPGLAEDGLIGLPRPAESEPDEGKESETQTDYVFPLAGLSRPCIRGLQGSWNKEDGGAWCGGRWTTARVAGWLHTYTPHASWIGDWGLGASKGEGVGEVNRPLAFNGILQPADAEGSSLDLELHCFIKCVDC